MHRLVEADRPEVFAAGRIGRHAPDDGHHSVRGPRGAHREAVRVVDAAAASCKQRSVRRKRQAPHIAIVLQYGDLLQPGEAREQNGAVRRRPDCDQLRGHRRHGQRLDVALDGGLVDLLMGARVPNRDRLGARSGDDVPTRTERHSGNRASNRRLEQLGPRGHLPQGDGLVLAAGNELGAVGPEGQGHDLVLVLQKPRLGTLREPDFGWPGVHAERVGDQVGILHDRLSGTDALEQVLVGQ
mmetsp:Transcript_15643/g.44533  ORF Transcript_15643/g.44533 Transcript_15643/m.44533 type:complete len:241 (-) Transcript_15643:2228-2950(-)